MNQLQTEHLPVPDEPLEVSVGEVESEEGEEVGEEELKGEGGVGRVEQTEEDIVGGQGRVSTWTSWEEDGREFVGSGVDHPRGEAIRGSGGGVIVVVGMRID